LREGVYCNREKWFDGLLVQARVTPAQVAPLERKQRNQILPAYTVDEIILAHMFQASTNSTVFEDFMQQQLSLCGEWPEEKSVL
jgi:hypothetical protein